MKTIIANWKSNKNLQDIEKWLDVFEEKIVGLNLEEIKVVITPPMPSLMLVADRLADREKFKNVSVGVQDLSSFPAGSYTGAVSIKNLEGFNVEYAIVGHSERRRYFHETDQDVANKVVQAVEGRIKPVLCVDEEYLGSQANALDDELKGKAMVAYEPLSAIGSGQEMDIEKVEQIKKRVKEFYGDVEFIYGGSVDPENVAEFLEVCNGVLVGTASLDVEEFVELIEQS
jgi:triosephosphate isomerase